MDPQKAASVLIEKQGPEYWKALQEELKNAVDVLPEEFSGSVTTFVGGLRVTINRLGMAFNNNHTDLFYKRGSNEILCSTLKSGTYALKFCITPDNTLAVKSTRGIEQMNPAEASEKVMQIMLA